MKKQKYTVLLYVLTGVLLIGGGMLYSGNKNSTNDAAVRNTDTSNSQLTVMENNFDFGMINMGNGPVTNQFEIVNNGTEAVEIGKVYTSCACTTAYMIKSDGQKIGTFGMPGHRGLRDSANTVVEAGKSVIVEIVYDPAFHGPSGIGLAQRSVYLETNSAKTAKVELKFQATVTRR